MSKELEARLYPNLKEISPKKHIIMSQQFSKDYIAEVIELTKEIKKNPDNKKFRNVLNRKVVASVFYEASTRTRFSFESAVYRLGGNCITTENAKEFSSSSKGESLEDSMKIISYYADMIILRHNEDDSSERAVRATGVPLINAGSGKSQHPTQALLDVYTVQENFGSLKNLNIAVVGDLLRGRTCDSLVYLLSKYKNNTFYFVSPDNSKIKPSLREHLVENGISFYETSVLESVLPKLDVCYMTRVQRERFLKKDGKTIDEKAYEAAKGKCILTPHYVDLMKKDSIIMHPLPRVDEIAVNIDADTRAKYFEQAQNGLYVRMALLKILADNN